MSLRGALATKQSRWMGGVSEDETPPYNPTEIAAALRASQRREERRCVTDHMNEYNKLQMICISITIHKETDG